MAVPLMDLQRQYAVIKDDLNAAIRRVFEHNRFILGPEVAELESKIAELCGVPYAVGVASGTDAVLIALRACGVGPGDEVITTDFSFFATAGVVSRLGAKPVFVDIEEDTYNINPALIEAAITDRTKAIVPVHLYGQPADMDAIMEIAERKGLKVVEDAAQAIGAEYRGRPVGSIGELGTFSFFPTKNLGGSGDGGMIVTADKSLYEQCRMLRVHGETSQYRHFMVGYNSRLDTLQAATLLAKLPHLRKWSEQRAAHAARYNEKLAGLKGLRTPAVRDYTTFHIYHQYTLASSRRQEITDRLEREQIGYKVYYPIPFHQQECFADLGYGPGDLPVAQRLAEEVFSIPVFPELTTDEQDKVVAAIRDALA